MILRNGTKAENVYWLVNGAVEINDYSVFNGTVVSQGAINLFTGAEINGRALTGVGAIETSAINSLAVIPNDCDTEVGGGTTSINEFEQNQKLVAVYPNPFGNSTTFVVDGASQGDQSKLRIYNVLGIEVISKTIVESSTTLDTSNLPSGMYFYKVIGSDNSTQTGRMISQK